MSANASTAAFTVAALTGFAANSLLCRMALGPGTIDAASFTSLRLISGALILALLSRAPGRKGGADRGGSWGSGLALFVYAVAFSFAYQRLATGTGALILFGAVQMTMVGWGLFAGERPRAAEWVGLVVAAGGLVFLTLPGLTAPDPVGAALMIASGIGWGAYSVRGRGTPDPLATTADNFLRSVPLAAAVSAVAVLALGRFHMTGKGALLACASGALASGVGYSLWYAALRHMTAPRAAVVQLSVPVLAAAAGVLVLGEVLTSRLLIASGIILGGVAFALLVKRVPGATSPEPPSPTESRSPS